MIPRNWVQERGTGSVLPRLLRGCIDTEQADPSQARLSRAEPSRAAFTRPAALLPVAALDGADGAPVPWEGAGGRSGERRRPGPVGSVPAPEPARTQGGREMIFVPFGSSPPAHSLVTKSTGTSSEQIISEGQHIAVQAAGKAPKFYPFGKQSAAYRSLW